MFVLNLLKAFGLDIPLKLQAFAELYLAGCTHREIAERLACVERTVERKLALVLKKWQQQAEASVAAGIA